MTWIKDYYSRLDRQKARKSRRTQKKKDMDSMSKAVAKAQGRPVYAQTSIVLGLRALDKALVGPGGILNRFIVLRGKFRNGGRCEVPFNGGCSNPATHAYHVNPRRHRGTRYDPRFMLASCNGCNYREWRFRDTERDRWKEVMGAAAFEEMIYIGKNVHHDRVSLLDIYRRVKNVLAGGTDHEYILQEGK